MADRQVDPSRLQGEALRRWYLRSPDDIEQQRQAAAARRYDDFFGANRAVDPDPGFSRGIETPTRDVDPGFSRGMDGPAKDIDPGFSWVRSGPNRWSNQAGPSRNLQLSNGSYEDSFSDGAVVDRGLAGPSDGGEFIEIGSKSKQHRRGWERREGKTWPTVPETGENFHVSHIEAKGDGGSDTLDNIEPLDPQEHMKRHRESGDFSRWGKRGGRPKAAPRGGPSLKGMGLLGIIPNITGILSGRIRTDSFDHFSSDMIGLPSQEDQRKSFEDYQRALNPRWKPGDPISV